MIRYTIPLVIFFALVILLRIGLNYDPRLVPSPFIDKPVPTFSLPQLKHPESIFNAHDLQGQVVLLNVWASWCIACRHEHPLLVDLAEHGDVPIFGLNYKDTREAALQWLENFGDPYMLSIFDQNGRVGIDLGVYGVPETFVLDRDGIIRYKHVGPITKEILDDVLFPLLQQLKNTAG